MPYAPDLSGCALDGRYELHAVIGEGAFGRVYRGHDRRLERTVAVKLIKPWWSDDPEWARSFEREARLLARVSDPGIVQIFDVGQAPEGLFYVSELVDGESLAQRLARGPMRVAEAAATAEQLCRALERAHGRQVVHRDVKPANLLISRDGQVKVGDFGVARLAEGSSDGPGAGATIVGTPRYMAPEQARGRRVTPATDVYSAGIVLYEMLAGYPPFSDGPAVELALRHLRDEPAPLPAHVPPALAAVVMRALAKDPAQRFGSGGAMADALAAARLDPGSVSAPGVAAPTKRGRRRADGLPPTRRAPALHPRRNLNPSARRRSIAALGAAFALLGAMIAGALILAGSGQVTVPRLLSLTRAQVRARTRQLALQPRFHEVHSRSIAAGRVVGQNPRAGRRINQGSTVRVAISSGPPPVRVPDVGGEAAGQAQSRLSAAGLRSRLRTTVAPRVPPGVVYSQSPAPGTMLSPSRRVTLEVAETPRWQPVTGISGSGRTTTTTFRIQGSRWRVVYRMNFVGTCTFIVFCSGPSAEVDNTASGGAAGGFGLSDGGRQTQQFTTGPGTFRLRISPGSDNSRWSAWVQDWY